MITLNGLQHQLDEHMATKAELGQAWNHLHAFNLRMAIAMMQYRQVSSVHSIGGFVKQGIILPSPGQRVIIPAGLTLNSMRPSYDSDSYKTDREVVVHRLTSPRARGFSEDYSDDPSSIRELPIEIIWAGKGQYWNSVAINDWIEAGGYALTEKLRQKQAASTTAERS